MVRLRRDVSCRVVNLFLKANRFWSKANHVFDDQNYTGWPHQFPPFFFLNLFTLPSFSTVGLFAWRWKTKHGFSFFWRDTVSWFSPIKLQVSNIFISNNFSQSGNKRRYNMYKSFHFFNLIWSICLQSYLLDFWNTSNRLRNK